MRNMHEWRPGDPLRAEWLDEPRQQLVRDVRVAGRGLRMTRANGVVTIGLDLDVPRAPSVNVKRVTLLGVLSQPNPHQWVYDALTEDGESVTATNGVEVGNDVDYGGPGVYLEDLPAGFSLRPIGSYRDGTYRQLTVLAVRSPVDPTNWIFSLANAVDGECTPQAAAADAFAFAWMG